MKCKILILSDPLAAPGYLPRVRYMCDFLARTGYDVTLATEQYQDLPFKHSYPILTIPMYSGGTVDWAIKAAWTLLTDWHNRIFAKRLLKELAGQQFDKVIVTTFSDFPLGAARTIAQHYHAPLVCDIRDLDEQVDDSRYQYKHKSWWTMPFRKIYRAIHIRRRNQVLCSANAITTISPWHRDFIQSITKDKVPVFTICNGYDPASFYRENIPAKRFAISYIGSLFDWQEEALQIVKQAIAELKMPIELDIHTPQSRPIVYDQLGDAIRRSSIMLVLTSPKTHGMLTTKFFEAFGCEKPVLCVPSDQGILAQTIAETNAGIATNDIEEIKAFITAKYDEWSKQGYTHQAVTGVENFSREKQMEMFETLMQTTK